MTRETPAPLVLSAVGSSSLWMGVPPGNDAKKGNEMKNRRLQMRADKDMNQPATKFFPICDNRRNLRLKLLSALFSVAY